MTLNIGITSLDLSLNELATRDKLQEHLVGKGYAGPPIDLEEKILTKHQVILTVCCGAAYFLKLVAAMLHCWVQSDRIPTRRVGLSPSIFALHPLALSSFPPLFLKIFLYSTTHFLENHPLRHTNCLHRPALPFPINVRTSAFLFLPRKKHTAMDSTRSSLKRSRLRSWTIIDDPLCVSAGGWWRLHACSYHQRNFHSEPVYLQVVSHFCI